MICLLNWDLNYQYVGFTSGLFFFYDFRKKYAAATTRDDAAGKSSKRVSFSSLETVNITRDDTKPDSGKPFKLSEKTRVNLQLQMMVW